MDKSKTDLEFEVMGYKVNFQPDSSRSVNPHKIVEKINKEALSIRESNPSLDNSQIAVLVALNIANERLEIEAEYREQILKLQSGAQEALHLIEGISPKRVSAPSFN